MINNVPAISKINKNLPSINLINHKHCSVFWWLFVYNESDQCTADEHITICKYGLYVSGLCDVTTVHSVD